MTPEERLASIDSKLAALNQRLTDHTAQDDTNFGRLSAQLSVLDEKLDQLLIREARHMGEIAGLKRTAAIVATSISISISLAGVLVAVFV